MEHAGFKAGIFDLDGVIVDTVPLHFKAWKRMFEEYGKKFTFADYEKKVDGIPRLDGARAILTDLPQDELEKAADKKQGYYLEELKSSGAKGYPSTRKLVEGLRKKNVKIAVISSSKNCRLILKSINFYPLIDTEVSGSDITKGKPDPQIFLMAAEKLGVSPSEAVVFEDAVLGVEAAKRGGFRCVGIDRHGDPERLKKADIVVKDLKEVNYDNLTRLFS